MKKIFPFLIALFVLGSFVIPVACSPEEDPNSRSGWEDMFKKDTLPSVEDTIPEGESWFKMKGVVCSWDDVSNPDVIDYVEIAKKTGINCFSIWGGDRTSTKWKNFEAQCKENGIDLEFEEHMLSYLLPRDLYGEHPEYYRMNSGGVRTNDVNGCPSCEAALEIIKKRAETIAVNYKSTNNRYYCWLDDGGDVCYCNKCKNLSPSDQALMFENAIIEGLRRKNPDATLAHLAYYNTVEAPKNVTPVEGIFLEFAPIDRDHYRKMSETWAVGKDGRSHGTYLKALAENLKVFPKETAMVLEYWLDDSLWSGWDRQNIQKVYWDKDLFLDDINTYAAYGIRNITCYTAWIGPVYVRRFGYPTCLEEYGYGLTNYEKE